MVAPLVADSDNLNVDYLVESGTQFLKFAQERGPKSKYTTKNGIKIHCSIVFENVFVFFICLPH